MSRLFACKSIEDSFCVGVTPPLIEPRLWVFNTKRHDGLTDADLVRSVFSAMRALKAATNPAVQQLSTSSIFYDWIEELIDPVLFRTLLELFASHSFTELEGDLLGRFFEVYAQKINKTKRKELGQYYTPQPVVAAIWRLAIDIVKKRDALKDLEVLDPGSGSGTFLIEGARVVEKSGQKQFWKKLTGFDISAQVTGIAYVNLYTATLGLLDRTEANEVADLAIYTTDALDPRNGKYLRAILPLVTDQDYKRFIEQRVQLSEKVKRQSRFTLIIGNPPYRNNSNRTLTQVSEIFPRLLVTSKANARVQERNPRDDYAWFLAAADFYVGDRGLIAFILSDSFCHLSSYRHFRRDLLRHYHVRHLVRLGGQIFQDVGPRIAFAIVVLEKRSVPLTDKEVIDEIPYTDIRAIAEKTPIEALGSDTDPRFQLLRDVADGSRSFPAAAKHTPAANSGFSFYPPGETLIRAKSGTCPLFEKKKDRIFVDKWPGIITAFDSLLKSDDEGVLSARMSSFFALAERRTLTGTKLIAELVKWSKESGIADKEQERLNSLLILVRGAKIGFDRSKIRLALDGAAPNSTRWYPARTNRVFLYFEPSFRFRRNVHEGKFEGWGDMQQWRDPSSHTITPKLIYTTGVKPKYGLKAFVVHDDWLVKVHGGTSQQYHYTGLTDPQKALRTDGLPNNLTDAGHQIVRALVSEGLPAEAALFYIATIYNSEFAAEYIEQGGAPTEFGIKLPTSQKQISLAAKLARKGAMLRNLHWITEAVRDVDHLDKKFVEDLFAEPERKALGLVEKSIGGGRFKKSTVFEPGTDLVDRAERQISELQDRVEAMVAELYP